MNRSNVQGRPSARLPPLMLPTNGSGADPPKPTRKRKKRPKVKRSDGAPNPATVAGAKAVWQRMRALEAANVAGAVPAPSEEEMQQQVEHAAALLTSPEQREAQIQRLSERYRDFVASVAPKTDAWRAVHKYVHDGQSHFNDYLTWTDKDDHYGNDVTRFQEQSVLSNSDDDDSASYDDSDEVDEDDPGDWSVSGRPERQVFALYGLFKRAPTLGTPTTVLHSTTSVMDLPHGPKEEECDTFATRNAWRPTPGRAYLNTTFVSTSLAPLNDFLSGRGDNQPKLAKFYHREGFKSGCCMCAITVDANVPVVPIFMENEDPNHYKWDWHGFNWHGFYGEEQEVLLPPGLVYLFLGMRNVTVVDEKATSKLGKEVKHHFKIFFYRAMLPPST